MPANNDDMCVHRINHAVAAGIAHHVAGAAVTVALTSEDYMLKAVSDRADMLETISDEIGGE